MPRIIGYTPGGLPVLETTPRCSVIGCSEPGPHDGMCGRHWWESAGPRWRRRDAVTAPYLASLIADNVPAWQILSTQAIAAIIYRAANDLPHTRSLIGPVNQLLIDTANRLGITLRRPPAEWRWGLILDHPPIYGQRNGHSWRWMLTDPSAIERVWLS